MFPVRQSTAETIVFFAHDVNGDAVTGMVDGGFTKRISKGSGAFAAMTATITEMENGWYSFPLSTAHSDTLGILTISLSNASCKRINLQWRVSARTLDELASPTNITAGTITTVTNLTNLPNIPVNWITAAGINAAALNGKGDWNIGKTGYALTATTGLGNQTANITGNLSGSVGSVTGAVGSVTGAVGSVTGAVGSVTGNVGGSVATVAANGITATSIASDAINAAAVKADAVTKIQSGLATPTNITAGTITTVTNVTNAPTVGDLTATMKTSVTTAATAATPTAAAVTGAVGSVTGNVGGNVVGSVASVTAGVTIANAAITSAKFDASTAFPLTSVDTGATRVARTGADADTLKTLSDQLDAAVLDGVLFLGDTQIA